MQSHIFIGIAHMHAFGRDKILHVIYCNNTITRQNSAMSDSLRKPLHLFNSLRFATRWRFSGYNKK